jgi:hypothetical protein
VGPPSIQALLLAGSWHENLPPFCVRRSGDQQRPFQSQWRGEPHDVLLANSAVSKILPRIWGLLRHRPIENPMHRRWPCRVAIGWPPVAHEGGCTTADENSYTA